MTLHGYLTEGDITASGDYICTKDMHAFTIHEFGFKYRKNKQEDFKSMVAYRARVAAALSKLSSGSGILLTPVDSFVENKLYYEAARHVEGGLSIEDIYALPYDTRINIMADIARALRALHRAGIAHGAICHENIHVIPYKQNHYSVKLSGFWHSGFYRDERFSGVELTDLYGIGLLFASYMSGYTVFDCDPGDIYDIFKDGYEPVFELELDTGPLSELIKWLLWGFGQRRPSVGELYKLLHSLTRRDSVGPALKLVK